MQTAMEQAFVKAGGPTRALVDLNIAHARFRNNGGTFEEGLASLRAAFGMPGEGHDAFADQGQDMHANARQTHGEAEGRLYAAGEASGGVPSASPSSGDGAGHAVVADRGLTTTARPSPTEAGRILRDARMAKEPDRLSIAAMGEVRKAAARAILKIDGQDILDFTIGEALSAARKKGVEHYVLTTLGGMYRHLPHTKTFREVSHPETVASIVKQAEAYAHAA